MSHKRASWTRRTLVLAALVGIPAALIAPGCSSTIANRNPVGEIFPAVTGESLARESVALPTDLAGAPAVILVGYKQNSQFDIDRWVMGLMQAEISAQIVELPTIKGLVPSFISGYIDEGMRSGIPREDWGAVVTLYGDAADPVASLTGTEQGQRARVIVLDSAGMVVWFDDGGYSARKALELASLVEGLPGS